MLQPLAARPSCLEVSTRSERSHVMTVYVIDRPNAAAYATGYGAAGIGLVIGRTIR